MSKKYGKKMTVEQLAKKAGNSSPRDYEWRRQGPGYFKPFTPKNSK